MSAVTFEVIGDPAAQGSKRSVGNNVFVETSKKLPAWRDSVATAARNVAVDAADALDVTHCADGSTPQAPTVDEPESDFGYDGFPPAPTPPTEDELGPWCCYAGEVGHPTSECSPENPIHAPTHCGYDNVRRGLVPAPPTVTDTDTVAVPRSALDRLIGCHRFFCMSGTSPCCPAGEWIAAAGVSSDR